MFDDSGTNPSATGGPAPASDDPAIQRFQTCRWHDEADGGTEFCKHGEVLPYAGRNGFNPRAWCLECTFYKARRKSRKRDDADLDDFEY